MGGSMYLALGYRCNHQCFFCPCGKGKPISQAETEGILTSLEQGVHEQGIDHVTLSGGEPTLHPDFPLILSRCVELGARVTVLTNGDSLSDPELVKQCFAHVNPAFVSVTSAIHSNSGKLHDRVTGVKGSFFRTVEGLKHLIPLGIPFTVKQCVSAWNYKLEFPQKSSEETTYMTLCLISSDGREEAA